MMEIFLNVLIFGWKLPRLIQVIQSPKTNTYDGIWACSSILHVEKDNLPNILSKMIKSLKDNGVIYTSFKIGTGYEIKEDIYYNYLTKEEMIQSLNKLDDNVKLIDYFETLPSTKRNAKNTIWGNFIIKKFNKN